MKTLHLIGMLGLSGLLATAAVAAGHLSAEQQAAIETRQKHMKSYGAQMQVLGNMVKGEAAYDAAAAGAAASTLASLAAVDQSGFWVEGTDASVGTRAKTEIWSNRAGYDAENAKLAAAATALAAVAGNDLAALQGAFGPVGQSCGSCHETYRAPRQ